MAALANQIKQWGAELGFQAVGIADLDLSEAGSRLAEWLAKGWHGEMDYMARHAGLRARPAELVPGTLRVITCRMDYLADAPGTVDEELADPSRAYVARYARGRDYHKVLRARLQRLCDRIAAERGAFGYRVFADSAPVMEVEIAARAGIGWRGKHTLLLDRQGSWFFLGEIYCDLPLVSDSEKENHCGTCERCIEVCPTQAIVAPYQLDARRCISYLTIEHKGAIPEELRPLIGNRVYGCDDCQLVCPWNKYAQPSTLADFDTRASVSERSMLELWSWTEAEFLQRTEGSAIRRIGWTRWRRNLAVGLGNAWRDVGEPAIAQALQAAREAAEPLVQEHIDWALAQRAVA